MTHSALKYIPRISLTGYEPELAKELAIDQNDSRLDCQQLSDQDCLIVWHEEYRYQITAINRKDSCIDTYHVKQKMSLMEPSG